MSEDREIAVAPGITPVNPFQTPPPQGLNIGTTTIEGQRAEAQVKMMGFIAHTYPRSLFEVFDAVSDAFKSKDLAEESLFAFKRGGKQVSGLTIRAAEAIARCMKHMDYGYLELGLYYDQEGRVEGTEIMAYAHDVQENVRVTRTWRNPHKFRSDGVDKNLTDSRDIREYNANIASRNKRECILALIPQEIEKAAKQQIANTIAGDSNEPRSVRLNKLLRLFSKYGVKLEHIEARFGKLEEITDSEYVELFAIYNALKEGGAASDWFAVSKVATRTEAAQEATERFKKPAESTQPAPTAKPLADTNPFDDTPPLASEFKRKEYVRLMLAKRGETIDPENVKLGTAEIDELIADLTGSADYQQ